MGKVGEEYLAQATGHDLVVDKDVGLEVVLERAEVDVRGAACGECIINNHEFGMQETRLVETDTGTSLAELAQIAARSPLGEARIGAVRTDDTDVDTRHSRHLEGEEHGFVGQEVGRLDVDVAARGGDGTDVALHDGGIGTGGRAGDHLRQEAADRVGCALIVLSTSNERAVDEIPVNQESALQTVDDAALHAQHGVAPRLVAGALDIALRYVHASDIAHTAVDDNDLAVVAVVQLAGERREVDGQEGTYLDAFFTHALEVAAVHLPAAYVVVDDAHLHPVACPLDEGVSQEVAQGVVFNNIHL